MSQFVKNSRQHFDAVADSLFTSLSGGEELTVNLVAEESVFVRFNGNRVRQNTDVEQRSLSIKLQSGGRTVEKQRSLSGRIDADRASLGALLQSCRDEIKALPVDPNQVTIQNNGTSNEEFKGSLLGTHEIADAVAQTAEGSDLAGLYAGGPVIRANRNSKGQNHWFATESFFLDYSLYNGPKAAKGVFAGTNWNNAEWKAKLHHTRDQLALLAKPAQSVKPGKYKTYLAP
ncbi:MAG: TldD/PmbA family protein, partial [Bdellovibrionota bacterium]